MYIVQDMITEDLWMTISEDIMTCTIMTEGLIGDLIEIDIINIRIATDMADATTLFGGCSGHSSFYNPIQ